jgi:hypothetical protein
MVPTLFMHLVPGIVVWLDNAQTTEFYSRQRLVLLDVQRSMHILDVLQSSVLQYLAQRVEPNNTPF